MRTTLLILCGALAICIAPARYGHAAPKASRASTRPASASRPAGKTLSVAIVQMRSSRNLEENVAKTIRFIRQCAKDGARVVVFPECSVTGYFEDVVKQVTADQLAAAEQRIAGACREANAYAVIGMPARREGKLLNSAIILSPEGRVIERYYKMQLAEGWAEPGDHLSVYRIEGVWCTTIICHDERYPELVRLPVLAGAQVVFYISHESGLHEERKLDPYRAQIQARAVENGVYILHANAPANEDASASHGQSRIVEPGGNILQEASMFNEDVLTATLSLSRASRVNATNAFRSDVLRSWWQEGMKLVRRIE